MKPKVAKVGGLQSQGFKVEIVVGYIDPLTTRDLKSSGFPAGLTTWQNRPHPLNSLSCWVVAESEDQLGYHENCVFAMILAIATDD